jgi:hypothetical protein
LGELARRAAEATNQPAQVIFAALLQREKLGTTGVGNGIAVSHGRVPGLDRIYGLFARLETPIEFGAIDEQPVDLIFLVLAPTNAGTDHLVALARATRLLRDRTIRGSSEWPKAPTHSTRFSPGQRECPTLLLRRECHATEQFSSHSRDAAPQGLVLLHLAARRVRSTACARPCIPESGWMVGSAFYSH